MKAAVYCRVSTDEQRERQTIDTQIDFATRYADLHGIEIVDFYTDNGVSGGIACERRPEGARLLADAQAGKFALLLVYRIDRLGRSLTDLLGTVESLEEWGVTLCSMTEPFDTSTPTGKFMLQLLGAFGELEKAGTRERSVTGTMRRACEGQWLGGLAPLGYKVEAGRLFVEPSEANLVHRIFTFCADEHMPLAQIADLLNAESIPMRNELRGKGMQGRGWHKATVSKILRNTTYLGENIYNKRKTIRKRGEVVGQELTTKEEQITRNVPPIIDPETFARAHHALRERSDSPANAARNYLLRGILKCGLCGCSYSGCSPTGRNAYYYKCTRYMTARTEERCPAAIVRGDLLEADVWADIVDFAHNPGKVMRQLRGQVDAQQKVLTPLHVEQNLIRQGIENKQAERGRVIGLVRRALITDAEAELELTKLQKEIHALEMRAGSLMSQVDKAEELKAKLADADAVLKKISLAVEGATEETKRDLIRLLVTGIQVDTVEENGKKKARISATYAFESAPERISGVALPRPLTTLTPASASPADSFAVASRP